MKKTILLIMAVSVILTAFCGCADIQDKKEEVKSSSEVSQESSKEISSEVKAMPELLPAEDYNADGGADSYANGGDHADSVYYVNPDFYNMKNSDSVTIMPNFKTMQQTTEYSCGAASVYMVLQRFGITDYDEMDLCIKGGVSVDEQTENALPGSADNYHEYGASVAKLVKMIDGIQGVKVLESSFKEDSDKDKLLTAEDGVTTNDVGNYPNTFASASLYASENSDETDKWVDDAKDSYFVKWITNHIKNEEAVIVEWGDWDGHWQVIIGYDTMGTASIGDDIIIFADPYDTSDHWQDGYYYYPAERWFYMWKDRNVAPKPFQLQPFMVLGKAE